MSISTIQNTTENISLIAAQRQLYTKAKKLRTIRITVSIILAIIIAPFTVLKFSELKVVIGILSSIWLITVFLINFFENRIIKNAATIQEQFDTTIFNLDWNKFLAGNKVSTELIVNAARKCKIEKNTLENWYGNLNEISHKTSILLCQRSNLVWDWRLRRYFAWTIIISLLLLIGIDIFIGYYIKVSFPDFILGMFLPSIPAFIMGIRETIEHFEIANNKEKLEVQITNLLDIAIDQNQNISDVDLRQIQDKIFDLRKKGTLIPDWWYKWLKGEFEEDMQKSTEVYKERMIKTLPNTL
ncbi:MAG TPA: S-4TM family putative pore-forming effector [Bacteroidales bacterium]